MGLLPEADYHILLATCTCRGCSENLHGLKPEPQLVETGWSMEDNLGEGTNTGEQGERFATNMQVSRKRTRDQGCRRDLVGLGDCGSQVCADPLPVPPM